MFNFIERIKKIQLPLLSSVRIFFDLGTSNTRIAIKHKGIVLREPTYLGLNTRTREYIFFGQEAKTILGKTPEFIHIVKPMQAGVLSDFDGEVAFIEYCKQKSIAPYFSQYRLLKPSVVAFTTAPAIATEIEQKAAEEALEKAGCSQVYIVEKPLATAAGCGFDIFSHEPHFVIDLGGGLIELSIVSGGGVVLQKTLKNAGEHMNKLITNYTYLKHGVILGEKTTEELKISLLRFDTTEKVLTVRGKSLETGLPKSVRMKTSDLREALLTNFNQIIDAAKELIELSPPEIADELFNRGITLTGGLAGIEGIDHHFSEELKMPVYLAPHYADATLNGLASLERNSQNFYRLFGFKLG